MTPRELLVFVVLSCWVCSAKQTPERCEAKVDPNGVWAGDLGIGGTYTLTCHTGFYVDENSNGSHQNPSLSLLCPEDGEWNKNPRCKNVDNCEGLKHGCGRGICVDKVDGYKCDCQEGYPEHEVTDGTGEVVCGQESGVCAMHSCGAKGICMALKEVDAEFGTTTKGGYSCSCDHGYVDNSSVCVPKDCGPLTDVYGTWTGNSTFNGDYTLVCNGGSIVSGSPLRQITISCPETGKWEGTKVCQNLWQEAEDARMDTMRFWLNAGMACVCIVCAAFAAGLTMGLVSIDDFEMRLLMTTKKRECESEEQREKLDTDKQAASRVLPLLKDHHLLLVTLLLLNSIANEALPIFLDEILPSWAAVLVSVTCVLFFGEILPSAIFTGPNQLQVAALMSPCVRCLFCCFYPIAKPIAILLDRFVGHEAHESKYHRAQLSAVLELHKNPKHKDLHLHEVTESSSDSDEEKGGADGVCGCGADDGDAEHSHGHHREPTKDDLTHIECSLAQKCLRLSSIMIKDLELELNPIPAQGQPGRASFDASPRIADSTNVNDAIDHLLRSNIGSVAIITSGGSDKGIVSFEGLFRASLNHRRSH